ncbi:hypothetical protein HEP_00530400, partial [Hepatocystis sp. ex Piliocolobus tephrosceles]
ENDFVGFNYTSNSFSFEDGKTDTLKGLSSVNRTIKNDTFTATLTTPVTYASDNNDDTNIRYNDNNIGVSDDSSMQFDYDHYRNNNNNNDNRKHNKKEKKHQEKDCLDSEDDKEITNILSVLENLREYKTDYSNSFYNDMTYEKYEENEYILNESAFEPGSAAQVDEQDAPNRLTEKENEEDKEETKDS